MKIYVTTQLIIHNISLKREIQDPLLLSAIAAALRSEQQVALVVMFLGWQCGYSYIMIKSIPNTYLSLWNSAKASSNAAKSKQG